MATPLPTTAPATKSNTMATLALITGLLGFFSSCLSLLPVLGYVCLGIGVLLSLMAIIFGVMGSKQAKTLGKGKGMAVTGIVLGALGILGVILSLALSFALQPILNNVLSQINSNLTP